MNRSGPQKTWTPIRIVAATLAAVVSLVLALLCWQIWVFLEGPFRTTRFDAIEWRNAKKTPDDWSCYRGGMAHDIGSRLLRNGQSQTEVKALLGEPDRFKATHFEYVLGMCSGLRIDFDTLDVHFSTDGKLVRIATVQH